MLEIHVEETDRYTLCRPSGELDAYTVGAFRESLSKLAGHSHLLIDLSEVPFMDSAGLGALIGGIRRAREADGAVAVACTRPALMPAMIPPSSSIASIRRTISVSIALVCDSMK